MPSLIGFLHYVFFIVSIACVSLFMSIVTINFSKIMTRNDLIKSCQSIGYFYIDENTTIKCEVTNANKK